jgi:hypothetical protein
MLDFAVDLERKRRCGMSRTEILSNIYCPATTPPTPQKFLYLPTDKSGSAIRSQSYDFELQLQRCKNLQRHG